MASMMIFAATTTNTATSTTKNATDPKGNFKTILDNLVTATTITSDKETAIVTALIRILLNLLSILIMKNAIYCKRRLHYIMDKIELNEIEEKLLQDAYTSYLKNKKWCTCHHSYHHSYSAADKQLTNSKVAGLEHLKKIIFIEVDRCVGLTSYNILPDGIGYLQSKY